MSSSEKLQSIEYLVLTRSAPNFDTYFDPCFSGLLYLIGNSEMYPESVVTRAYRVHKNQFYFLDVDETNFPRLMNSNFDPIQPRRLKIFADDKRINGI